MRAGRCLPPSCHVIPSHLTGGPSAAYWPLLALGGVVLAGLLAAMVRDLRR